MRIHVGSTNEVKVAAVKEVLVLYPKFEQAEVSGIEVNSGVGHQPMNLMATIDGAINRAKAAFADCDLSIGIEGGVLEVPQSKSGAAMIEACAVYNGTEIGLGFSCAYVIPEDVHRLLIVQGLDMSEAFRVSGRTSHQKIGTAEGGIGFLTEGRLVRKDMCKQALITALIHAQK